MIDGNKIYCGDNLEIMKDIPDNSIDAVVTDPPYGLEFMGKEWDKFRADDTGTNRNRGERVGSQGKKGSTVERWGGNKTIPSNRLTYGAGKRNKTYRCVGCGKRDQFRNEHKCKDPKWKIELIDPHSAPPTMLAFQNWTRDWASECLRVLKPGGFLLAFG